MVCCWYYRLVSGVQFFEANLITPNIVGSKVSINPLMSIVGLLLGGMLFGLAGLILALPLIAIIKVVLDANSSLSHFGFLIGEPDETHLKSQSSFKRLREWRIKKALKNTIESKKKAEGKANK